MSSVPDRSESRAGRFPAQSRTPSVTQECKGKGCGCRDALKNVCRAMKKYARTYSCTFPELSQEDISSCSEKILEGVQLVLCDPPYNYRRENNLPNSTHDNLSKSDMNDCVREISQMLREGGHAFVFCSALQFKLWYDAFALCTIVVSSDDEDEQDEEESNQGDEEGRSGAEDPLEVNLPAERLRIFSLEPSPVLMNSIPGHYYTNAAITSTAFRRVSEMAVHVTKKGLNSKDAFALVNYDNFKFVSSCHPAWTNIIDNVPRLEEGERLKHPDTPKSKFVPLRPE